MLPRSVKIRISNMYSFYFFMIEFIASGINLFSDQSPPPITLPARPLASPHFLIFKKTLPVTVNYYFSRSV